MKMKRKRKRKRKPKTLRNLNRMFFFSAKISVAITQFLGFLLTDPARIILLQTSICTILSNAT
jgi:hypothetical protein